MRMMPTRLVSPQPSRSKPGSSTQVAHIAPPLKGLNLSSKLTVGDPLTAPILKNFVIEDDRIRVRPGTKKMADMSGTPPVASLVPWYGASVNAIIAAGGGKLFKVDDGSMLKDGFGGDDWSWTSFSNLGQTKYTVMCNGVDGVWSWDGQLVPDTSIGPFPVTSISKANPAVCTASGGTLSFLTNGQTVLISGVVQTGFEVCNGYHTIANVNSPAGTFQLVGVNTTAATAASGSGTADPITGGIRKEAVTAPPTESWINPNALNIAIVHMNRLFFADSTNLAVYYLPLQSMSGELKVLPLNALFRRGGHIQAMATWTLDGGTGIEDRLCIFSSNGELVVYAGVDPDDAFNAQSWQLVGIFRFDSPMSKHCVIQWGGDLYVLISSGLVPMTTTMRAETEQLGKSDQSVVSLFLKQSMAHREEPGWWVNPVPSTNRVICNMPQGAPDKYIQLVRHMPRPVWSQYEDLPARCSAWVAPYIYFGTDSGAVYQMHPDYKSDDGEAIRCDVQMSWSLFKTVGIKQFKMVRVYCTTDTALKLFTDVKVDYDLTPPEIEPDVSFGTVGAEWDVADWDSSGYLPVPPGVVGADWAQGALPISLWNGVASLGRVGAPRLVAQVRECEFELTGFDVLFEPGAAV